ncbi:pre-mRNA-splicing factor RSE1 [Cucumis melo var. makuwa]|uniref:Pre-mRNA-splicing factor RSE1 n=1 Tax=Cucumis melo var. makuwa TaxID=1194695 RepID=A0A5D3DQ36_CUCMM|nr:pre-mRNA-splicing factor RSE1 [Cucumis melo var. makuwa]
MAVSEEECSSAKSRSSSSTSSSTYYLAKCVLRGSVVLQVLYGHIRSPSSLDVVFGKETSIELVVIGEDGVVQSVCEQAVFGTIKDMAILPWNERFRPSYTQMLGKDLLIVISDSGKLSFLSFCNKMHRFLPMTHIQLSNPGNSRNQIGRMLASDSSGCFIAASAYENCLALFSTSISAGSDIVDKRITYPPDSEGDSVAPRSMQKASICGTIWSMCFISKDRGHLTQDNSPILAVLLNRRGAILNELLLLGWNVREQTIHVVCQFLEDGPLAYEVVEVPQSYGFALLFRVGDALLMDLRDAHSPCCVYRIGLHFPPNVEQNFIEESYRVQDADDEGLFNVAACALLELRDYDPMCIDSDDGSLNTNQNHVCSWSWEPGNNRNRRMIFCMDTGDLFMIEMNFDSDGLKVNQSACLYKGQPYKALLWVEGGYLAALVEMGDGMVLKLENGRLTYANPIQNIAPILDMSVVDKHDEKQDQMFACCGMAPEGSLRIIRNGISVENLLRTSPIYQGITSIWTIKMKLSDAYHSYLVLSFVEETRVLSVGLSFIDVTDSVGFQSDTCTLACGLLDDGLLVQIYQNAVRVCLPTKIAHSEGIELSSPACTSWFPDNIGISLGAVGHNVIVVSTSNPCFLFILGVRKVSGYDYQIYEKQYLRLQNELSCISIPEKHFAKRESKFPMNSVENSIMSALLNEVSCDTIIVIGTHRPSVEILSFVPSIGLTVLASGTISLMNILGNAVSGCIPQDVRLVLVDRFYILTGLRNGMLLRFEWPHTTMMNSSDMPHTAVPFLLSCSDSFSKEFHNADILEKHEDEIPSSLQLIAIRRIGITPVFLVPLTDRLDSDIIALSDRPWLLHSARHSLSYTSISFQPSTHVTPVCSADCPSGLLFVAESSLHLVMNWVMFLPGRDGAYQETECAEISPWGHPKEDPLSGSILSSYKLEIGETGKSMELVRNGNEQVLVVGTSLSSGPAIMPSGEAESTKGRLIVFCLEHVQNSDTGSMTFCSKAGLSSLQASPFREIVGYATEQLSSSSLCSSPDDASSDGIKLEETEAWHLRVVYSTSLPGMVLAICPYLDRYFLASAGNAFYVCGFPNDSFQRVKRFAVGRTRFMITSLTAHVNRIAVGDCRDGILFFSYQEDAKKLEQIYSDPSQRLVADCTLLDVDTAVVSDRKGSIAILSCSDRLEDNASPECNLTLNCAYYMGEIAMTLRKGSFSYKLPADDLLRGCAGPGSDFDSSHNTIIASTLLGSIVIFTPLSRGKCIWIGLDSGDKPIRDEYELLEAVQAKLAVHPLTSPILGNDHYEYRSRENPIGVPKILDGDILTQFLELTSMQQELVLSSSVGPLSAVKPSSKSMPASIPINQVVQLLERIHYALN